MEENKKIIEILEKIDRKLAFLIAEGVKEKHTVIKEQIAYISNLTQDYKEIALMLGITPSHASKELSKIRKKNKK